MLRFIYYTYLRILFTLKFSRKIYLATFFLTLNITLGQAQIKGTPLTLPDIQYHLTAKPWQPLNISRVDYLDKVEGIVRQIAKFQDSTGAIIDPYEKKEIQYSTPYFANAIGTLISAGKALDLLSIGISSMNNATAAFEKGVSSPDFTHGEFFIAPLSNAISL
ncbi:MAG: hypothetical protein ABIO81_00525, partial [Ginsengibacter sp.]